MDLLEWMEDKNKTKKKLTERKYFDLCFVAIICALTLIFAIIYTLSAKTIYFWDDATYWEIGRMLSLKPFNLDFLKEVYLSLGTQDYNYFPAVLPALWMKLFGITRVSYISCLVVIYLIPTQIMIFFLSKEISKVPRFAYAVSVLSMPALFYIACIGFIDVGGVFLGITCYYLYLKSKNTKHEWLYYILLGILLTDIMLFRRYFAFFSVSFVTVMIIDGILFKKNIKNAIITVLTIAILLIAVFNPFFVNILLKDYGTLYSSYKYGIMTDLKLMTRYYGVAFIASVLSLTILNIVKKRDMRSIFAILQLLICFVMFVSTQTHGQQHLLLYVPGFAVLLILGINCISKRYMLITLCAVTVMTAVSPMIKREQPENIQEIKSISFLPTYSAYPKTRTDAYDILSLRRKLDKTIPEGKKCGVLASSFTLNSSILDNVTASLNIKDTSDDGYITGLPEVDSRDYWRLNEIYTADYLLVAQPAQIHLKSDEQTIICEAVSSFANNTDIATFFDEVGGFAQNMNGIEIKLYKRVGDISLTAKTEFEMRLFK